VIKNDNKTVLGSSHSLLEPQLIVIVFTPDGEAELTFDQEVLSLEFVQYEPWGSNPNFNGPTSTSV